MDFFVNTQRTALDELGKAAQLMLVSSHSGNGLIFVKGESNSVEQRVPAFFCLGRRHLRNPNETIQSILLISFETLTTREFQLNQNLGTPPAGLVALPARYGVFCLFSIGSPRRKTSRKQHSCQVRVVPHAKKPLLPARANRARAALSAATSSVQ